jgi:hypothetical protein
MKMSEANKPLVGKGGSLEGKRWFVSGCGDLKITVSPNRKDRDDDGNVFEKKGEYIAFTRTNKPDRFVGGGYMGNMNPSGMDLNRNRVYGIFVADGDTAEGRKAIEFLRRHHSYLHVQNDELFDVDKLKLIELSWDPTTLPSGSWINGGVVARTDLSIKKPEGPAAPADIQPEPQVARVADMSKKFTKPAASILK